MASVTYSRRGKKDMAELLRYLLSNAINAQEFAEQVARILKELEDLAEKPMLGNRVSGVEADYRYWLIFDKRYRVYFERLNPTSIQVGLIRRAVTLEPNLDTIKGGFKKPK